MIEWSWLGQPLLLAMQTSPRGSPVSFRSRWRQLEHIRGFFYGKTAEDSELHSAALQLVEFSQFVQSVVESGHIHAAALERQPIQGHAIAFISLGGIRATCVPDQNLPHQPVADGKEMSAVFELERALFLQPQVSLVPQGGALEDMVGAFLPQIAVHDPSEFVINQRKQGAQRFVVAGTPVREQLADDFGLNVQERAPEPPAECLGSKVAFRRTDVKSLKRQVPIEIAPAERTALNLVWSAGAVPIGTFWLGSSVTKARFA